MYQQMPEQVRRGLLRHLAGSPPGFGHVPHPLAVAERDAAPATPMFTCPYRGRAGRPRRSRSRPCACSGAPELLAVTAPGRPVPVLTADETGYLAIMDLFSAARSPIRLPHRRRAAGRLAPGARQAVDHRPPRPAPRIRRPCGQVDRPRRKATYRDGSRAGPCTSWRHGDGLGREVAGNRPSVDQTALDPAGS